MSEEIEKDCRSEKEALNCKWVECVGASFGEDGFHCFELWCHSTPLTKRINHIKICQKCKCFEKAEEEK